MVMERDAEEEKDEEEHQTTKKRILTTTTTTKHLSTFFLFICFNGHSTHYLTVGLLVV